MDGYVYRYVYLHTHLDGLSLNQNPISFFFTFKLDLLFAFVDNKSFWYKRLNIS